jgi:hypothetical protein
MTNTLKGHIVTRKFDEYKTRIAWRLKPSPLVENVQETTTSTVLTTLETPEFIEIAGVRMEAANLSAPTQDEIEKFHMVELKDGDEANEEVPQYGFNTISDYEVFKRAFPHHAWLTEEQAKEQHLFPHTYCAYNKLARSAVLTNRHKREWNDTEWAKLMEYAQENGNNKVIEAMKAWFVGFRNAVNREFVNVGDWSFFGISVDASDSYMPCVSLDRGYSSVGRSLTDPERLVVVRAFSVPTGAQANKA